MAVQFHNAPDVSPIQRSATISSGQSSADRESPAEHYTRQGARMGTDSLQMGQDRAKSAGATATRVAASKDSWKPNPIVGGIVAVAMALSLVYEVGGLQLAIVLSFVLLGALLAYGLGADRVLQGRQAKSSGRRISHTTHLAQAPRLRHTGPLG